MYRDTMRDFWRGQANVADFASRFTGSADLYESRRPAPVRVDQLHHRARRLHAERPRLVQRQAQRGEPRGQQRRHRRQPLVELRRRRADRRPGDPRAAPAPAAQLPHDAAPLAGRADAPRRRRVLAHAARQQQRVVPGQRALVVPLGLGRRPARAARVHPPARAAPPRASGLSAARVPRGHRRRGLRPPGRLVDAARRAPHDAARLEPRRRARDRRLPERRGDPDADAAAASPSSTTASCCSSTGTTSRSSSSCRRGGSARAGSSCSRPRSRTSRTVRARTRRASGCRSSRARSSCSAAAGERCSTPRTACSCGRGSASARRASSSRT